MKLYDHIDIVPLFVKLEDRCPICQEPLEIDKSSRSLRFPELECPKCHLRIKVTTRNNDRISAMGFASLLIFVFSFLLGTSL